MPEFGINCCKPKFKEKAMQKTKKCLLILVVIGFIAATMAGAQEQGNKKINLNTCTAAELVQVKGIGPKLADKIIEYRKANGPFKKAEDIVKVPGIGPKMWAANKDVFTVDSPAPAKKP